jgi:hypothetical protein
MLPGCPLIAFGSCGSSSCARLTSKEPAPPVYTLRIPENNPIYDAR